MAEETIPISVSPEAGSSRRKSISVAGYQSRTSIGTNPRRFSTGKPSSQNNEDNVPNYLRASTGSCHDMCKYGHAHAFKAKDPIPKRRLKSVSKEQKDLKPIAVAEGKKTTMAKLKPSPDPKTHAPDPPEVIKREIVAPSKKLGNPLKRISSAYSKVSGNDQKTLASVKLKPVSVKSTSASYDAPVGLTGIRNSEGGTSKRMGVKILKEPAKESPRSPKVSLSRVAVKKVLPKPTASNSPKPSFSRVISLKARKHKNLKLVSPLKDQNRMPKTKLKQHDIENVQEKTLHIVGAVAENEDLEPVPAGDNVIPSSRSPPVESPESSSTGKSEQSPFRDQENQEEESEYTESDGEDYISETDETLKKADGHEASRKGRVVPIPSGDKDVAAVKLKFRRGKVVDLQSDDTNAPRRLRFRRARVLGDNEDGLNSGARRRNIANKGIEDHEAKGSDLGSESVTLKHQDVQGKKDAQILLNNVIEETASKLVESRKSKVKALVGAFETVISLQDTKPSAQTVT